jgi:hypothetical protein
VFRDAPGLLSQPSHVRESGSNSAKLADHLVVFPIPARLGSGAEGRLADIACRWPAGGLRLRQDERPLGESVADLVRLPEIWDLSLLSVDKAQVLA